MAKILIDGNALGHSYHNSRVLSVGSFQTQAIFGFIRGLRALLIAHEDEGYDPLILWDSPGGNAARLAIFPEYKANRETDDPEKLASRQAYRAQVRLLRPLLGYLGMRQVEATGFEADDLACLLAPRYSAMGQKVLLVTGDSDWWQLIDENVRWHDPRYDGRTVDLANFHQQTGYFTPAEALDGKCLTGDSSDGIPPLGGIGKKGAPQFLAQFKSVEEFWRRVDSGEFMPTKKAHQFLASEEGRAVFNRNKSLIDMRAIAKPSAAHMSISHGKLDEDAVRVICERLAFISILKGFGEFIAPFKRLSNRMNFTKKEEAA